MIGKLSRRGRLVLLLSCFVSVSVGALSLVSGGPRAARGAGEAVGAARVQASFVTAAADPAMVGAWDGPRQWPIVAVHSLMLHTGKVLIWSTDQVASTAYTWDPITDQFDGHTPNADIFCAGHSFLPDGRVLVSGGTIFGEHFGPNQAFIFDPLTLTWSAAPDMRDGRYYPTQTTLGDGTTLIFAGKNEDNVNNRLVERFVAGGGPGGTDIWELLTGLEKSIRYYPRMHLMPSGKVLHVGETRTTSLIDTVARTWTTVALGNYGERREGTSVMLPPGHQKIMIIGGLDPNGAVLEATNTAEIIDMSAATPAWAYTGSMTYGRMHANAVILPDGKVLVAGGTADENITPVYPAEIYDPATATWTVVASMSDQARRGYHSSAVLLPDGRALWAGANGNPTAEVYSPPYLFRGPRPVISAAPSFVGYGQRFSVETPDAAGIASAVFMRPGATTHSINMEQRYVPLVFTQTGATTLEITAPSDPNIAQPGYYMLFLLDGQGVPAVAPFVRLTTTPPGNQPPSVDAGPPQSVIFPDGANLDGTVSDDGLPSGTLTTTWSVDSGPGTVTFADPSAVDTTATFSALGTYTLRLTADDGQSVGSDTVVVTVGNFTVDLRIAQGIDDAEESSLTGKVQRGSTDLELVYDGNNQSVGLRFGNVPVPQGAEVISAWVQFKVDEVHLDATTLTIQGQAADSAPVFATTAWGLSTRPRTTAAVSWSPVPWTVKSQAGPDQRTPDLTAVIQEIVDRPGWDIGNALVLILTGTGHRTAEAFEGDAPGAPLLHIELAEAPVNQPPVVSAGPDRPANLRACTVLDGTVADDGLPYPPGAVGVLWSVDSGPGTVIFGDPAALDPAVGFSEAGTYVLRLTANDGTATASDTVAITVSDASTVLYEGRITVGSDDAEQRGTGSVTVTSTDLELVFDLDLQVVGLRFPGVLVPQGANILDAWVQFKVDEAGSDAASLTIQGQAADSAPTFTTSASSISTRPRTAAAVGWTPAPWTVRGAAGVDQRTSNLAPVIQEVVDRGGWTCGNSLVLIFTGSGRRTAESFEGDAPGAPLLHIEY